jgi:hypothetical protein
MRTELQWGFPSLSPYLAASSADLPSEGFSSATTQDQKNNMTGSRVLLLSYAAIDCDLAASSPDLPSEGFSSATAQDQEAT